MIIVKKATLVDSKITPHKENITLLSASVDAEHETLVIGSADKEVVTDVTIDPDLPNPNGEEDNH